MKRINRRAISDAADVAGIGCIVAAGWAWNTILGLALLGVGFLVTSAFVVGE